MHAVTNWMLEPKQNGKLKTFDLTEAVADKATATVKSGGGGDFVSITACLLYLRTEHLAYSI